MTSRRSLVDSPIVPAIVPVILLATGLFLLLPACSEPVDIEAEKAAVERAVRGSIEWALNKDKDLLFSVMAHDEDFFIWHPDSTSTVTSWDQFARMTDEVFMAPTFRAIRTELKDLHIGLTRDGTAAWFRTHLDDIGEWSGVEAGWLNVRWSGTLEKRSDGWKVVQMHFSFPTDRFTGR